MSWNENGKLHYVVISPSSIELNGLIEKIESEFGLKEEIDKTNSTYWWSKLSYDFICYVMNYYEKLIFKSNSYVQNKKI